MAGRKLATSVNIDGTWYRAGDTLPEDVAAKVRNPKVFALEDGEEADQPRTEPGTPTGARLASRVQVDGKWYGPNDAVPDDVAARITNPRAWEGGKAPSAAASAASSSGSEGGDSSGNDGKAKGPAADRAEPAADSAGDGSDDDTEAKPRRGRGRA